MKYPIPWSFLWIIFWIWAFIAYLHVAAWFFGMEGAAVRTMARAWLFIGGSMTGAMLAGFFWLWRKGRS